MASISRDDLVDFHAQWVRPEGATLVVAGDVDPDEIASLASSSLGRWASSAAQPEAQPPADERAEDSGRIVFVHRPGSVQTELYVGTAGPTRRAPGGWAPYPATSYLLGGSPSARLDQILREEKGYTYGMRSGFRPRRDLGTFAVTGSVRTEVTGAALEVVYDVLESSARDGFTQTEVRDAVDFISKTAPNRYSTADVVADEAAMLSLDRLDTDFVTDYLADLGTLDAGRVSAAWQQVAGNWTTVLVGDADTALAEVEALGVGPVTVVVPEEN